MGSILDQEAPILLAMANAAPLPAQAILDFWFGGLDPDGWAPQDRVRRWFKKDPAFDDELRTKFMSVHSWAKTQVPAPWQDSPEPLLAYVILLDQMSRNMFRNSPEMYQSDALALAATHRALNQGWDAKLAPNHRIFLYMPLMHAESLEDQELCVQRFSKLHAEIEGPKKQTIASNLHFAEKHRDIVLRFGRFPHRNEILSRQSSPEELEFLKQPGSSF